MQKFEILIPIVHLLFIVSMCEDGHCLVCKRFLLLHKMLCLRMCLRGKRTKNPIKKKTNEPMNEVY